MKEWIKKQLEISHGTHNPLKTMEGLRGVAVFLVFLVHYSSLIEPWLAETATIISSLVHSFGHLGVDLFFILSGYLIYGTIITKNNFDIKSYTARRIIRIYPTFIAVLSAYVLLSVIFPKESKFPTEALPLLTYLTQNILFIPGLFDIKPIITVAWSLSYEVFYYISIPLVIIIFSMKKWKPEIRILFWTIISILGFILAYLYGGPSRLLMFIPGIILFEIHKIKGIQLRSWGTTCLILALVVFGLRSIIDINYHLSLFLVYILFFIFCLNSFSNNSFSSIWLIYSPLRWLGNMSYSYYLVHGLTLKFLFLLLPLSITPTQPSNSIYFGLLIPFFIATLITSFCLFVVIERPFSITRRENYTLPQNKQT